MQNDSGSVVNFIFDKLNPNMFLRLPMDAGTRAMEPPVKRSLRRFVKLPIESGRYSRRGLLSAVKSGDEVMQISIADSMAE